MNSKKLIVIAGPTAVGKTDLAIRLAQRWQTAIVSADSRQVFREMTIGTAKPSIEQLAMVAHYFIGSHSIHQDYDAGRYGEEALDVIHQLFKTHEKVVLCGGSGLYIKAVCEGFDDIPPVATRERERIIHEFATNGLAWLQQQVRDVDPVYFALADQQNPRRLMRALEVYRASGKKLSALRNKRKPEHHFEIVKIGVNIERELLYTRIDDRVDAMIRSGLIEEAKDLFPYSSRQALQTVGYAEAFGYLENRYDLAEAINLIKKNTRNYAKRQLTWFRRDKEIRWFHPDLDEIVKICETVNEH